MEANSLLYFLIHQCHQCLQRRPERKTGPGGRAFLAVVTEKAAQAAAFSGLPQILSHPPLPLRISPFVSGPQPPTKQGPEPRCSGIPPLLSSGIRARHLERGLWDREKYPNINPLGPWPREASASRPRADQRLLATFRKPELPAAAEGDS